MTLKLSHLATRCAGTAATIAIFAAALWALHSELAQVVATHVGAALAALAPGRIALAMLVTTCGYIVLTLYDRLGLAALGRRLPWRTTAEAAFLSFAISHNVGLGWLSAGAMRNRVYARHGLNVGDVARLTLLTSLTFFVGSFVLVGSALVLAPDLLRPLLPVPAMLVRGIGGGLILLVVLYLALCATQRGAIGIGRFTATLPTARIAVGQIALSCIDLLLTAAALYFALPAALGLSFPTLLGIYLIALAASVLTPVPGGLGVFEALIVLALPAAPRVPLLAGLIAFRVIYYLLPLGIALAWLAAHSLPAICRSAALMRRRTMPLVPPLAAGLALACGIVLLLSGATPAVDARLHGLREIVPLPLLELSHLAGSVTGLALVILAHALYRRYDSARVATIALLAVGAGASLLKGWDFEEASLLVAGAAVLALARQPFFRAGSLWRNFASPGWIVFALVTLALSVAVGLDAYAHVPYRAELWWQAAYAGDAPRFLRASLAAAALGVGLLVARLLHAASQPRCAEAVTPAIAGLVAASPDSSANLALTGDKRFLVAATGTAFLMYQIERSSWIAMGDPIGHADEWPALIWALRDLADRHGGRAVFYEAGGDRLDRYADAGLVGHKIGEEARVDLAALDLARPAAKEMRAIRRRAEREGLSFRIVPAAAVPALLDTLEGISDDWLYRKIGREKGFSLGRFDRAYLTRFDCAVVDDRHGPVAFANIWRGADHELSVDLMRHASDAPKSAMAFLLVEMMLAGKTDGFTWFNLGMAPLAGMAEHRLAPLWHRIGRFAFAHGERVYGFDGLRRFKQSFHPVWRSRYLVCRPTPTALASALTDAARLIGRAPPCAAPAIIAPMPFRLAA